MAEPTYRDRMQEVRDRTDKRAQTYNFGEQIAERLATETANQQQQDAAASLVAQSRMQAAKQKRWLDLIARMRARGRQGGVNPMDALAMQMRGQVG